MGSSGRAFRNLGGHFVHPTFVCLSEEKLKAGGPFYLVSTPGEIKYPTRGVNDLSVVLYIYIYIYIL